MSKIWSPLVKNLVPYVPGEQPKLAKLVKLNTNENPYGPSPKAIAAMQAEVNDNLRLYPDPNSHRPKQAVVVYSSSLTSLGFFSYSFYPVYCGLYGIDFVQVPLDEQFQIRVEDYVRPNGGIIFPNPNAPTGCGLALEAIERLLKANPDTVVLVDEAYIDFGGETAISLVNKYPNLLVSQTLSKSRSLAGLRVGIAVGHPDLIEALERIKNSFNSCPLDRMAIAGAAAAFEDKAYFEQTCQRVIESREAVVAGLEKLGFEVLPSQANFVFARHPDKDAATLAAGLREQGVIVRHFKQQRIAQFLRITIGTPEQNQALLDALQGL